VPYSLESDVGPRDYYGKGIFEGMWIGIVTATTVGL
jgi:hypothetical protein